MIIMKSPESKKSETLSATKNVNKLAGLVPIRPFHLMLPYWCKNRFCQRQSHETSENEHLKKQHILAPRKRMFFFFPIVVIHVTFQRNNCKKLVLLEDMRHLTKNCQGLR